MSTWVKPVPNILGTGLRILSLFIFFPHLSMFLRVFVVFLVYIWSLCVHRTVSTRPETPSEASTTCGGPLSTALRPSRRSTKAMWCLLYYTALNARGWQRATSPSCQSSTQKTSGESCKPFGLTLSPTNSYSPGAIKTAWRTSSWEGDGDGLGTSWGESRTTSLAQPFTGYLNESAREEDQETPGAELWSQSSEAGPEPTDVAILRSRPTCHTA